MDFNSSIRSAEDVSHINHCLINVVPCFPTAESGLSTV